jgi:hypothetical protein
VVEDNGIGLCRSEAQKNAQEPLHRSLGLEDLQKRIKIMNGKYDFGEGLHLVDLGDETRILTGTRVVLEFNSVNI